MTIRSDFKQSVYFGMGLTLTAILMMNFTSCGKSKNAGRTQPVVTKLEIEKKLDTVPSKSPVEAKEAVRVELTLNKQAILGRTFLYGSDVQYSSISDPSLSLVLQTLAIGHVPCSFHILGSKLQLVGDQSIGIESDVNHPDRLIHEFDITHQDDKEVTFSIEHASPTAVAVVADSPTATLAKERTSWVRSVEFVPVGNYILLETSIELANGQIAQFMESLFPRETLVPENYKPILADADREPKADRFRFLASSSVFLNLPEEGRVKTATASRYNIKAGESVDWYVTPNVPEEYLATIKSAVEGWNRYSQAMWKTDFVKFKGKMPEGMKIGDPRYNIINWDNVAEAGAAYESQAIDPSTGIQSHSLIYLPLAWVNIGKKYWRNGEYSDNVEQSIDRLNVSLEKRRFMGQKLPVHCVKSVAMQISLAARDELDTFSKELLKGVLFHEMGHAFGLDHNFKGSLSYNSDDASTRFSTSIMDYNQYNIERGAFESVDSDKGPLLEYDRQIISTLYNNGADIKSTDVREPVCNDSETDDVAAGVDPLCIRYDAGSDPTKQGLKTLELVSDANAASEGQISLPRALAKSTGDLGDAATVTDAEILKARISKMKVGLTGVLNFYFLSGAQSIRYMAQANVRSLYVFKDGILPENMVEESLHTQALQAIEAVAAMDALPAATKQSFDAAVAAASEWMLSTPYLNSLPAAERTTVLTENVTVLAKVAIAAESSDGTLAKMRMGVVGNLKRIATAPFYFGQVGGTVNDLEKVVLGLLEKGLTSTLTGNARGLAERSAYATALASFGGVATGKEVTARVVQGLQREEAQATNAVAREDLRTVLAILPVK